MFGTNLKVTHYSEVVPKRNPSPSLELVTFGTYCWGKIYAGGSWQLYQITRAGLWDVELGEIKIPSGKLDVVMWDFKPIPEVTLLVSVPKPPEY